jgi:hypothetical protein
MSDLPQQVENNNPPADRNAVDKMMHDYYEAARRIAVRRRSDAPFSRGRSEAESEETGEGAEEVSPPGARFSVSGRPNGRGTA